MDGSKEKEMELLDDKTLQLKLVDVAGAFYLSRRDTFCMGEG